VIRSRHAPRIGIGMVFGLNGAGVDAVVMEGLAYPGSHEHEVVIAAGRHVYRCDDFRF